MPDPQAIAAASALPRAGVASRGLATTDLDRPLSGYSLFPCRPAAVPA